jgi:hypothetical protein
MSTWNIEDIKVCLKSELNLKKQTRDRRRIELECMTSEIDNLEMIIFEIERHTQDVD